MPFTKENNKWEMEATHGLHSHKLPGAAGCPPGSETFPSLAERSSCFGENRQFHSGGLYQQAGRAEVPHVTHTGTQTDSMEQCVPAVNQSNSCTGRSELWSRPVIQRQPTLCRLEASPRSGESDLVTVRSSTGGHICISGECSVPPIFLPTGSESPTGSGCTGTRVAEDPSLCIPPGGSNFPNSCQSEGEGLVNDPCGPTLARETLRFFHSCPACHGSYRYAGICCHRHGERYSTPTRRGWPCGPGL